MARPLKLDVAQQQDLLVAARTGRNQLTLAADFGIGQNTVSRYLRLLGHATNQRRRVRYSAEEKRYALAVYRELNSARAAARELGINSTTISKWARSLQG